MDIRLNNTMSILILGCLLFSSCQPDTGFNTLQKELQNQTDGVKVMVFSRNTGVGSSLYAMISIVPMDERLAADHLGNIFRGKYIDIADVKWEMKTLKIWYRGDPQNITLQVVKFYAFTIEYFHVD